MKWLENLVARLAGHVDKQLDSLATSKDSIAATDAVSAGDHATGLKMYCAHADQKHSRSATCAGTMYFMGQGTKANAEKAIHYLKIGVEAEDAEAVSLLGMAYAAGMSGVKKDYAKARPLLEIAVKNGDSKANEMLEIVRKHQRGRR